MKMVLTSEVENVDNWLANRQERHATISQFAENIVEYTNEDGSGVVALTFKVTDEEKMNDLMQDDKTRAEMIRLWCKTRNNHVIYRKIISTAVMVTRMPLVLL